ncbi:MAG: MBL fold metallo-hydrolase [Candidatus Omnitrophica bacterium]|nr:MBL fold metallo-hydrolase [Candidatus Omnitrophota bacterium]
MVNKLFLFFVGFAISGSMISFSQEQILFHAIEHASFVIQTAKMIIYVDPVGDPESYLAFGEPDLILITHDHYDHLDPATISRFNENVELIGPESVVKSLNRGRLLKNGQTIKIQGAVIEAVPMYNLTEDRLQFHPKGKGNGYVLTVDNQKIYISGDTEDVAEIRALKNIDYAFICINLPYTMTVDQAVSAVLEFSPKMVYPYHYHGDEGYSDIARFKKEVESQSNTKVTFLKWYKD